MIRKAFSMSIHPDSADEYEKRHDPIWTELEQTLKQHGVHNYSIFMNSDTGQLFAYAEIESEERWQAIAKTDICQKWWAFMRDIMLTDPNSCPVSIALKEAFHLP